MILVYFLQEFIVLLLKKSETGSAEKIPCEGAFSEV
jgi:hypothetical protein